LRDTPDAQASTPAVLCLGGDWTDVDVHVTRELIERFRESPEQHAVTFSQAAATTAPCVLHAAVVDDLAAARAKGSVFGSVTGMLGYVPTKPRQDPITRTSCVIVPPACRDRHRERFERVLSGDVVAGPRHITFDVGGGRPRDCARARWFGFGDAGSPCQPLQPDVVHRVVGDAASFGEAMRAPLVVTLRGLAGGDGAGDPIEHPALGELMNAARDAGAAFVHVRTDLAGAGQFDIGGRTGDALADADIVSVDILAQTHELYTSLTGRHDLDRVRASCEALWERWCAASRIPNLTERWLIPRLTRCAEAYGEVEAFFDLWTMTVGAAAIDPLPMPVSGSRIAPLTPPTLERLRRSATELAINSQGDALLDERPTARSAPFASLVDERLEAVWLSVLASRREANE
jgi:hypothetical protein